MICKRTTIDAFLSGCVLAFTLMGAPADGAVPEYEVKTALIYKISKFIRWPEATLAAAHGTLHVCITGRDDFGPYIDQLKGQNVQGLVVSIDRLPSRALSEGECHILFISRSERQRLPSLLRTLDGLPVLTVSDIEEFAASGGMIGFTTANSMIRFQINPAASKRNGIEIGAQLLQLATLIDESKTGAQP